MHVVQTFTPKEADGEVEVKFVVDASSLKNSSAVVFEKLYFGDIEVANHEDIEDNGQTISFIDTPSTGDSSSPFILLAIMIMSAAASIIVMLRRRTLQA